MNKYIQLALNACILTLLCFLFFRAPKQVFNVTEKTIEKHIKGAEHIIEKKTVEINRNKSEVVQLNGLIAELQAKINQNKQARDTFLLVQNQDGFIHLLQQRDTQRTHIIANQDTVIQQLHAIVAGKDSIIYSSKSTNKRLKRQRNLLIVTSSVLGSLLLIK